MHVKRVHISNVRGFGQERAGVDLDLTRPDGRLAGWTVFAGPNGSGKTTLLQSIAAVVAGPQFFFALFRDAKSLVRQGNALPQIGCLLARTPEEDPFLDPSIEPQDLLDAALWFPLSDSGKSQVIGSTASLPETPEQGPWAFGNSGWFAAGYGPFRRFAGSAMTGSSAGTPSDRIASLSGLFQESVSLQDSIAWLKEINLRKREEKPEAAEIEAGLLRLLGEGLLPNGSKPVRVDSDGLWVEQRGITMPLQYLSDGYRVTAAFVIDLVMRMQSAFREKFRIEQENGKTIIPHSGVVLVDEMEEHLHPSWQQRIGFWLKEHFPNIQFLVTTHSPFICQAADPGGLIRLAAPGEVPAAKHVDEEFYRRVVYGGVDEAVVTELFGLPHSHSEEAEQLREQVAELEAKELDENISEEEQQRLEELREKLPSTPSSSVDQTLRRLEHELEHAQDSPGDAK